MSTTLTNGLKLPDKGSVDWYADMQNNYTILDGAVGTIAEHTSQIAGKAPLVHTHGKADITDLLNSNFIPSANNSYDLGSSSYQWNNAYIKSLTINGVACGDILTHNVNEFVDVTSAQTITGVKTFTSNIIIQGGKKVVCNIDNAFIELNGGTTWGKGGSIVLSGQGRSSYANSVLIVTKSDTDNFQIQYQNGSLKPVQGDNSLGTSSNKWKTLNGVNPGALSLPESIINLDTTNWDLTGAGFTYTPTVDGWLYINIRPDNNYAYAALESGLMRANSENTTGKFAMACIAVRPTIPVSITLIGASIAHARLVTCAGNV